MIETPTVLVLGAGVSHEYDFPLAYDLMTSVINDRQGVSDDDSLMLKLTSRMVEDFRKVMSEANSKSIDDFLETRQDYLKEGKYCIAKKLIACEKPEKLRPNDKKRFYQFLWHAIKGKGPEDIVDNNLRIITFNYDRSLEYALYFAIRATYGLDDRQAAKVLRTIPIHHVYGMLGRPYFDANLDMNAQGTWRNYQADHNNVGAIMAAMEGIKLVEERGGDPEGIESVRDWLCDAERIVFLGFSYDPLNLERIGRGGTFQNAQIFGTSYEMTPIAKAAAQIEVQKYQANSASSQIVFYDVQSVTLPGLYNIFQ